MKTLIIEDDPIQALNLKVYLRDLGLKDVTIVANLVELKLAIKANQFDLLFCDINLPDVDGITLLAEYLHVDITRSVIIVSIVEDEILRLTQGMCNQLGYHYVNTLSKPFTLEELKQVLKPLDTFRSLNPNKNTNGDTSLSETEILDLISAEHLFSVYQPQFSLRTGQLIGVEALARLDHKTRGVLLPSSFMPQVNDRNLVKELYVLMLKKSTAALSIVEYPLRVSINITRALLEQDLYQITTQICDENNFPLSLLTLELTEEQAHTPSPRALANIARLKVKGVKFSIDDFGTGYASLEQLIDLPFSEIKINRKFINRVKNDYKHQQLTTSALRLAQSLGLQCVAVGVENFDTWEYLRSLGVDSCQGYYTGKPRAISELLPLCQVAFNQNDKEERSARKVVLLFDNDITRGKATIRLLKEELTMYSFQLLSKLEEARNLIRDLPVSFLLVEQDRMSKLGKEQLEILSYIKQRVVSDC